MKIAITGGGTGGHLAIAKALAQAAQSMEIEAIFLGSNYGQDRSYFEASPLFSKKYFFDTQGVVNKRGFAKVVALFKILKAVVSSIKILHKERVDAVISVGGFSAAPASFAALLLRKPFFIHEQNAAIGRLNALLKPFAKAFFSSYDPASPTKAYPVDETFFQHARVRKNIQSIIFLGGSQGAKAINDLALSVAKELQKRGIKIIHQSGKRDFLRVQKAYEELGVTVDLFDFSDNLVSKMAQADLAVSRSGASTLWELCANGLVALFIPYPYAAADHQYFNAKFLADQKLAWIERESENPKAKLLAILDEDLEQKSKKLIQLTKPGGAKAILNYIQKEVS